MDYTELKAQVARWLKRTDLDSNIPDLIALAETKLGEDLRGDALTGTADLVAAAGNAYVYLPDDFRNVIALTVGEYAPDFVTAQRLMTQYAAYPGAQPQAYTMIGDRLRLAPVPDAAYPIELVYRRSIPPLTDLAPTNWLLERSPNAYLFGALMMAQPFILKDERMALFQQMYTDAVATLNINEWHTGGTMAVRSDGRVV